MSPGKIAAQAAHAAVEAYRPTPPTSNVLRMWYCGNHYAKYVMSARSSGTPARHRTLPTTAASRPRSSSTRATPRSTDPADRPRRRAGGPRQPARGRHVQQLRVAAAAAPVGEPRAEQEGSGQRVRAGPPEEALVASWLRGSRWDSEPGPPPPKTPGSESVAMPPSADPLRLSDARHRAERGRPLLHRRLPPGGIRVAGWLHERRFPERQGGARMGLRLEHTIWPDWPEGTEPKVVTSDVTAILRKVVRPGDEDGGESVALVRQGPDLDPHGVPRARGLVARDLSTSQIVYAWRPRPTSARAVWCGLTGASRPPELISCTHG